MKIIKMQKRNKKTYFVTLSVSDYDIEMLEDIALCDVSLDEGSKYYKWLRKTFYEFQKIWKKYDK